MFAVKFWRVVEPVVRRSLSVDVPATERVPDIAVVDAVRVLTSAVDVAVREPIVAL